MDQPNIMRRGRSREVAALSRTVALQLAPLQDRFGPSSLSGLAESAMLGSINVPVEHVAAFTTSTATPTTAPAPVEQTAALVEPARPTFTTEPPTFQLTPIPLAPLPEAWSSEALPVPTTTHSVVPPVTSAASAANSSTTAPPKAVPTPTTPTTTESAPAPLAANIAPRTVAPTTPTTTNTPAADTTPPANPEAIALPTVALDDVFIDDVFLGSRDKLVEPEATTEEVIDDTIFPTDEPPVFEWSEEDVADDTELRSGSLENTLDPSIVDKIGEDSLESTAPTIPMTAGDGVATIEMVTPAPPATRVTVSAVRSDESDTSTSGEQFRLRRAGDPTSPATVSYQITAFQGTAIVQQEGTVTIPAGAQHVDVAAKVNGLAGQAEVVTITVRSAGQHQGPVTATLMNTQGGSTISDAALFAAYRHGPSPLAFQQLLERHQAAVYRTAYHILGHRADAEDISQLVFLALARQEMTIQTSLHYWLQKVTRNASIAFLRAKSRRLRHETEQAKLVESPSIEDAHALQDQLQVALAHLPSHLSEAVRLRYLEGWTQQEAAGIIGCPRGTLSQRASQGLQTLRELLSAELRDAG